MSAVVELPAEWRREGMVVVVDSATGELLGCMGRATWNSQLAAVISKELICTCPSGDGSLRWPCPEHPPQPEINHD